MIQLLKSSIIKYDSCRALWHRLMHTPSGKSLVTVDIAIYKSLSNSNQENTFLVSTKSKHFNFCPYKKIIYRVPVKYKKLLAFSPDS